MATRRQTTVKAAPQKVERKPKGITVEEAVRAYQNDPIINSRIVENTLTDGQKLVVEALDKGMRGVSEKVLNRVTIPFNIESFLKEAGVDEVAKLKGKAITTENYMSTTKNDLHETLERRYHNGLSKPVAIIIHTEGKCKGIDVNETLGEKNGFKEQNEVILARNQRFLVENVEMRSEWGEAYPVLHLHVI